MPYCDAVTYTRSTSMLFAASPSSMGAEVIVVGLSDFWTISTFLHDSFQHDTSIKAATSPAINSDTMCTFIVQNDSVFELTKRWDRDFNHACENVAFAAQPGGVD